MNLSDFEYKLPQELIAQYPATKRAEARMLVLHRQTGQIIDSSFKNLPDFIDDSYFMVMNDSRVFKARLYGHRQSGGKVEIFLVRKRGDNSWLALMRPSGRIKKGERILFDTKNSVMVFDDPGSVERIVAFESSGNEAFILKKYGQVPLPPYIGREAKASDVVRYQTVYARESGSVAAPTAGLHFDKKMLTRLSKKGIRQEYLTLHVGPGTFKPVVAEKIEEHQVDPEYAAISKASAETINRLKKQGRKLLAVGTTSVRTLEASACDDGTLSAYDGPIDLFIYPPYQFRMVDALLTNFHLPRSSLLMLVSTFCGHELIMNAYRHAVEKNYRFYSYGDCMLIL